MATRRGLGLAAAGALAGLLLLAAQAPLPRPAPSGAAGPDAAASLELPAAAKGTPNLAAKAAQAKSVAVAATPIARFVRAGSGPDVVGRLAFRGGLVLKASGEKQFGSLSALRLLDGGTRLLAVSDRGRWLTARVAYDHGRPSGLAEARLVRMSAPPGRTKTLDTEGFDLAGSTAYVSTERDHRVLRFDLAAGLGARARELPRPAEFDELPSNGSLETLVVAPAGHPLAGALVVIAERGYDAARNHAGWILGGPRPGRFGIVRHGGYDPVDAAFLPDGGVLLLERGFGIFSGFSSRIRRLDGAAIAPGAVLDGPVIFEAFEGSHEIDNLEGIAVHRDTAGATVVTLVSDDNFSRNQREILLQFTLRE